MADPRRENLNAVSVGDSLRNNEHLNDLIEIGDSNELEGPSLFNYSAHQRQNITGENTSPGGSVQPEGDNSWPRQPDVGTEETGGYRALRIRASNAGAQPKQSSRRRGQSSNNKRQKRENFTRGTAVLARQSKRVSKKVFPQAVPVRDMKRKMHQCRKLQADAL